MGLGLGAGLWVIRMENALKVTEAFQGPAARHKGTDPGGNEDALSLKSPALVGVDQVAALR